MSRHLGWALALALLVPSLTVAHSHPHSGSDDDLGWILIDGERQSMSDMRDIDDVDDLKARYGDEVLCIREGDERYVITKPVYMERARKAARRVSENKEIVKLARTEAKLAMSRAMGPKSRAKLVRMEAQLQGRIARNEAQEDFTKDLERELERVRRELDALDSNSRTDDETLTGAEERDLERRREGARARLQVAVQGLRDEIREILREARAKGDAERLR
jgi:hypothetical protein